MLQQVMMKNKKVSALLLIGAAAFAYYKYSKMTPAEKEKMITAVKENGQKILGQMMPMGLGGLFSGAGK